MNPDVQALLTVQADDTVIRDLEGRIEAITPRLGVLDAAWRGAMNQLARTEAALAGELERQRAIDARLVEQRARHERSVEILNHAHKVKEATAAAAQVETARRGLADDESEALAIARRLADLRTAVTAHREAVASIIAEQAAVRETLAEERVALEASLATVRERRAHSARAVNGALLAKYDRIHTRRRTAALVPLQDDYTCGACDTAIPLQRRLPMASGAIIEPCEGCGVLLYSGARGASGGAPAS